MFINPGTIIVPKGCVSLKSGFFTWLHIRITRGAVKKDQCQGPVSEQWNQNLWEWVMSLVFFKLTDANVQQWLRGIGLKLRWCICSIWGLVFLRIAVFQSVINVFRKALKWTVQNMGFYLLCTHVSEPCLRI